VRKNTLSHQEQTLIDLDQPEQTKCFLTTYPKAKNIRVYVFHGDNQVIKLHSFKIKKAMRKKKQIEQQENVIKTFIETNPSIKEVVGDMKDYCTPLSCLEASSDDPTLILYRPAILDESSK